MIYSIVEAFREGALKHRSVWTFKYQDKILINALPNNKYYLVILETDGYFDLNRDGHTLTINLDVLGFVDVDELTTQDIASLIGLSIINKVVSDNRSLMSLIGYSILLFTKSTDDSAAGARFTIRLAVPSFMDYCIEPSYFLDDEEYELKLEKMKSPTLDLGEQSNNDRLDLNPIKL